MNLCSPNNSRPYTHMDSIFCTCAGFQGDWSLVDIGQLDNRVDSPFTPSRKCVFLAIDHSPKEKCHTFPPTDCRRINR